MSEVRRNIYGSALELEDSNIVDEMEEMEEEIEEPVAVASNADQEKCGCKGKCARKTGRGACRCLAANLRCEPSCKCSAQKCKNRQTTEVENAAEVPEGDGGRRFENEVQRAEQDIEEFIGGLDSQKKEKLLIKLLSMGRGSLDFAKYLLESLDDGDDDPENPPPPPPQPPPGDEPAPPWCRCGVCNEKPTEIENICCKRTRCITSYNAFFNICLDIDILEVCIKARCDIRADEFNFSAESFRKAAYRQYALWTFGKLGRGNRRVLPSCVVRMIRAQYESLDRRYMGFRAR